MASEYAVMNEEEVNELYAVGKYIAKKNELKQWASLHDAEAKKKFLYNFWKTRDEESTLPTGEFKRKYLERVKYSNDNFNLVKRKGWLTDRGRVYITYGEPSEIERFPNQNDTKPYEIWHYNELEGGVVFVFADFSGFNDYQLIHSTLRGELRDDNWQSRITVVQ
jgi:GWxTD domain-containing protein